MRRRKHLQRDIARDIVVSPLNMLKMYDARINDLLVLMSISSHLLFNRGLVGVPYGCGYIMLNQILYHFYWLSDDKLL